MHRKAFQSHLKTIFEAAKVASNSYLQQARDTVFQYYRDNNPAAFQVDGTLELAVSYDGTWFRRGHTYKILFLVQNRLSTKLLH